MPIGSLLGICVCPKSLRAYCKRSNLAGYFIRRPKAGLRAWDLSHIANVVKAYSGLRSGDHISLACREATALDNHNCSKEGVLACFDSRKEDLNHP